MGGRSTHEGRAGQGTARRPRRRDDMEICRRQLDEVGVRSDEYGEVWGATEHRGGWRWGFAPTDVKPTSGRPVGDRRHCS